MTDLGYDFGKCKLGDKRLTARAASIGQALSVRYGQALSMVFDNASDLKRAYEFFANPKTSFSQLAQPHHNQTAQEMFSLPVVLAVGDTSYLDYKQIIAKRSGYGPIGQGGNGLLLHSTFNA